MPTACLRGRRRGAVTSLTALLLIPLFALVAFAVDLNYIWTVDAELQNAADAAAIAATTQLMQPNLLASLPKTGPAQWKQYLRPRCEARTSPALAARAAACCPSP